MEGEAPAVEDELAEPSGDGNPPLSDVTRVWGLGFGVRDWVRVRVRVRVKG